jgi:hypothetical protein
MYRNKTSNERWGASGVVEKTIGCEKKSKIERNIEGHKYFVCK